ncbi:MAG TPA: phage tail tape measure protein [Dehalococcoidia bacterium]|nr:phage tail tape measure protein [Dehalococcoidia bacterium]
MPTSQQQLNFAIRAVNEAQATLNGLKGQLGEVEGATDKASGKLGFLGNSMKTLAGAGIGGALGGALGMLGKQTLELDTSMAELAAQAGLTSEQTNTLKDAVIDLHKNNLQGQSSIAGVIEGLISLQGVSADNTDEIKTLADQYLNFATATKQDAAQAVAAFDDILDAWGLTAKDAGGIMDALVLSHQQFGLSITDAEGALKTLAPAMKTLGLDINDTLAFLNMFAASGIDANTTALAFNQAVAKLSDSTEQGQSRLAKLAETMGLTGDSISEFMALDPAEKFRFLAENIGKIEDPTKRAEVAIDLFGTRAGPKLAEALASSGGDLQQFEIDVTEASGAAEEAANKIENSFTNKLKLLGHEIMGRAQELTGDFAPALMMLGNPAITGAIGALGGAFMTPPVGLLLILAAAGLAIYLFRDQIIDGLTQAKDFVEQWAPLIALALAIVFGPMGAIVAAGLLVYIFRDQIIDAFTTAKDETTRIFTEVKDFLGGNWQEILSIAAIFLLGPAGLVLLFTTNAFGIRDKVIEAFGGLLDFLSGWIDRAWDWAFEALKPLVHPFTVMIDAIKNAIEFIGQLIDKITSIPKVDLTPGFDVPGVPGLAHGGIVTKPTLAMIGEGGPEAVIPLNKMALGGVAGAPSKNGIYIDLRGSSFNGSPKENAAAIRDVLYRYRMAKGLA